MLVLLWPRLRIPTWDSDFEFSKFKSKSSFSRLFALTGKAGKAGKQKSFLMSGLKKIEKHLFLSINYLRNERIFLQYVFKEVIRLIGSLVFNMLCFGSYFRFKILNLLFILVVHCKLKLFYFFQIFVGVSDNIVKLLIILFIFITYSTYQIFKVPFLCILTFLPLCIRLSPKWYAYTLISSFLIRP